MGQESRNSSVGSSAQGFTRLWSSCLLRLQPHLEAQIGKIGFHAHPCGCWQDSLRTMGLRTFLSGCWPEASFSSFPHVSLSNMPACFKGESANTSNFTIFCVLVMEVTLSQSCHILLITSKLLTGRVLYKAENTRRQGSLGATSGTA